MVSSAWGPGTLTGTRRCLSLKKAPTPGYPRCGTEERHRQPPRATPGGPASGVPVAQGTKGWVVHLGSLRARGELSLGPRNAARHQELPEHEESPNSRSPMAEVGPMELPWNLYPLTSSGSRQAELEKALRQPLPTCAVQCCCQC
ncbi:hypothetical protein P7K49_022832 [Saguinus oedipus]|uniref:Uncharacterized protein n=1 Tax=Saguinus oedipus TaxID=9490 RepID=A0ABQ9UJX5_SAGOE|nr:hypothetical protein P7K49_022832 [Saguinus oedipus]